jgi:hypothetical protein
VDDRPLGGRGQVFGITFRTPPEDSTGVPHILEHSVLCGSRKFPVKEPFVDMLKGSLNTFLNAFTYPDRTCYPVASQNIKDFYNLVNVYLDAVLHPRAVKDPLVRRPRPSSGYVAWLAFCSWEGLAWLRGGFCCGRCCSRRGGTTSWRTRASR